MHSRWRLSRPCLPASGSRLIVAMSLARVSPSRTVARSRWTDGRAPSSVRDCWLEGSGYHTAGAPSGSLPPSAVTAGRPSAAATDTMDPRTPLDNAFGQAETPAKNHTPADGSTKATAAETAAAAPAKLPPLSAYQRWLLACLGIGTLLAGCCTLVQVPFFPHEARKRGLSSVASSSVFSAFALSELLTFPAMGWLAPRLGVTRLYQLGMAVAGLTTVTFGLLTYVTNATAFLAASLTVRVAEAVGTAATQTAARTIVASQFRGRLNTVMGFVETMSGAGLSLGPALGGALYGLGGYGTPFYLLGGLHLVVAAVSLVVMPAVEWSKRDEPRLKEENEEGCSSCSRSRYVRMFVLVVTTPDNWLSFVVLLIASQNWVAMDTNLEVYVHDTLQITPAELGLFFLGSFIAYAVASPVWGRVSDAVDNTFLLVAGLLAPTSLGVLLMTPSPLLGLAPSRLLLALGMATRELFLVGAYLPLMGLLLRRSVSRGLQDDVHGQSMVAAVYGTVYSIGKVAGPMVGSLLTDLLGYPGLGTCLGVATMTVSLAMAARGEVYACRHEGTQSDPALEKGDH